MSMLSNDDCQLLDEEYSWVGNHLCRWPRHGAVPARVYLLNDHDGVRDAVRVVLNMEADIRVVGDSASAAAAVREITSVRPDVAILDCRLSDGSGVEVSREVTMSSPATRVLLLTSLDPEQALLSATMSGASGYVLKGSRARALADSIRAIINGEDLISPNRRSDAFERAIAAHSSKHGVALGPRDVAQLMAAGYTDEHISHHLRTALTSVRLETKTVLESLDLTDGNRHPSGSTAGGESHDRPR